jgi:glyoxylase-like metal-dependent hydrolase (beta-lactamase superfamily II)
MPDASTNAGFYSYKVGDYTITAVSDGYRAAPMPENFITNAPRDEVNAALEAGGIPRDQTMTLFTPNVIQTRDQRVLFDTGMGAAASQQPGSTFGLLTKNLAAAGIPAEDIDLVVISHFHPDHVNGLWDAPGKLAFPRAAIAVPEVEWKFWMDDGEMSRATPGRMQDLFKNNRRVFDPIKEDVIPYAWDKEVAPGIMALGTPGHSIGHTSYLVHSDGEQVYILSDVTNHPALFVRHPGWQAWFDQDPAQAEQTRMKTLDMLATEKIPVQAFHFPFPGRARIEKDGNAYREIPLN